MIRGVTWRVCFFACALSVAGVRAVPPGEILRSLSGMATPSGEHAVAASATVHATTSVPGWNVTLLSQVLPQEFATSASCPAGGSCANDCWGYISPSGREYAIIGLRRGTGFVDITDPLNPEVVGSIDDADSIWSDIRTFGHYAYNVNESGGGVQVFDLSNIDPPARQVTLVNSLTASGLQRVHNIVVNEASQTLYLCGSNLGGGRLIAVSLADPANPVIVGSSLDISYVHDAHVVTYTDGPYAGREIAFVFCGSAGMKILDVTNKANMFRLSTLTYPNMRYCHQGRVTNDRQYVIFDDELDELQDPAVTVTTTRVVDVSDLSNPVLVDTFTSGQPTIDHNLYIKDDYVFEANYTSGLQIFNISDIFNAVRVGYYDTYPLNNSLEFDGAWSVWPYFPSGTVIVSDIQGGLFVLDASDALGGSCEATVAPAVGEFTQPRQRYLSVTPGNAGVSAGLRVRLSSLPTAFQAHEGEYLWVDTPVELQDPKGSGETYFRSRLRCTPRYLDWGAYPSIEIADDAIVPGGTYEIQTIAAQCNAEIESNYSSPLVLATPAVWSDVVGNDGNVPPNGLANAIDVAAVVDGARALPGSLHVTEGDLNPSEPDFLLNAMDVARAVDAVKGAPYPFPGPATCP